MGGWGQPRAQERDQLVGLREEELAAAQAARAQLETELSAAREAANSERADARANGLRQSREKEEALAGLKQVPG